MERFVLFSLLSLFLTQCISTQREKQMRQDIFTLQTKMEEMERISTERGKLSEDSLGKKMAGANNQIDKLNLDLARMKGELDTLRVGVVTGQLPDADPEKEGGSLLQKLNLLTERLDKIESQQVEILAGLGSPKEKDKALLTKDSSSANSKNVTLKDLTKAFDKKKYKQVIEMAPSLAKGLKGNDLQEYTYMLAESLYKTNKYRDSALKFNEFLEQKPSNTPRIPFAKMRMGDCFRKLGDQATAKLYYQEIVDRHPDSAEAPQAKERLSAFNKRGNRKVPGSADKQGPIHATRDKNPSKL